MTRVTAFIVDTKDTRRGKTYDAISVDHRQCVWDWAFALGNGCVDVGVLMASTQHSMVMGEMKGKNCAIPTMLD